MVITSINDIKYDTLRNKARALIVDENNKIHNTRFIGGCGGNLQGIAKLVEGKDIDEIEVLLKGIRYLFCSFSFFIISLISIFAGQTYEHKPQLIHFSIFN